MIGLFNEAYDNKEMSSSQRQAIITLIDKKGKNNNYLENWRLISLTNVDKKIVSKVIAARIIPDLPKIINNSTQTGYVKGRFIGEAALCKNARYTRDITTESFSLDWNFMLKSLNVFCFGPSLIRWIETLYSNISVYSHRTLRFKEELGKAIYCTPTNLLFLQKV